MRFEGLSSLISCIKIGASTASNDEKLKLLQIFGMWKVCFDVILSQILDGKLQDLNRAHIAMISFALRTDVLVDNGVYTFLFSFSDSFSFTPIKISLRQCHFTPSLSTSSPDLTLISATDIPLSGVYLSGSGFPLPTQLPRAGQKQTNAKHLRPDYLPRGGPKTDRETRRKDALKKLSHAADEVKKFGNAEMAHHGGQSNGLVHQLIYGLNFRRRTGFDGKRGRPNAKAILSTLKPFLQEIAGTATAGVSFALHTLADGLNSISFCGDTNLSNEYENAFASAVFNAFKRRVHFARTIDELKKELVLHANAGKTEVGWFSIFSPGNNKYAAFVARRRGNTGASPTATAAATATAAIATTTATATTKNPITASTIPPQLPPRVAKNTSSPSTTTTTTTTTTTPTPTITIINVDNTTAISN